MRHSWWKSVTGDHHQIAKFLDSIFRKCNLSDENFHQNASSSAKGVERCCLVLEHDIPISHLRTHFPKHPRCIACIIGRAERLPIIHSEHDRSRDFDGERIHIFADLLAKLFLFLEQVSVGRIVSAAQLGIVGLKR